MALIPLNTFKTKTAVLTTAEYNNKTCARDTGLIIDSIAFDLLYGYNVIDGSPRTTKSTQSTFSGLQYWAQDAIKIPGDVLQTLAALDRAKEISKKIIVNSPVTFSNSYPKDPITQEPTPAQFINDQYPGSIDNISRIVDEYDLISKIIENGTKGITDLIVPNEHDIKNIAINWTAETLYKYGTILKAQDGSITNYYKVIKEGTSGAISNPPTHISGIAVNGTATLEYILVDETIYNAAQLLLDNKELIQEEVIAYIKDTFNTSVYDKQTFIKNTQLIVDSLAFDLLFNGSSQSKFAGLQYWTKGDITKIPLQVEATIASIQRMKTIVQQIIKNELVDKSPNNLLDQVTDILNPGNFASITAINNLFDLIISILNDDLVPDIISNGQLTTYVGLLNAYNLIQANRQFIQEEIIAWIDYQIANDIEPFENYPFTDEIRREKCYRDTGYIIDCISFDLVYTSTTQANRQSVQAGIYYYTRNEIAIVSDTEQSQTITALNYLKSLIDDVVMGESLSVTYQSDIKQLTNLPSASNEQSQYILSRFNLITDIIEKGPQLVDEVEPISLIQSKDINDTNGFRLLLANKDFLVAEAVAFINNLTDSKFNLLDPSKFDPTKSKEELCKRDVGYIVDSIIFDLRHGGNRQAIQSGVYYYDHSAKINVIPRERIDTTEAYNYMKTIIESVLKNENPVTTYQSAVKQFTNLDAITDVGTIRNDIISAANSLVSRINLIISSNPSVLSQTDLTNNRSPIELSFSSYDTNELVKAFNLLLANKEYIIAEVISYLNTKLLTRPNTTKIYTAPPGVTAIILMAQAANVTDHNVDVTFAHYRNIPVFADPATYNGYQAANTVTELVKDFTIPPKNAATLIDGKMIIETFDSIIAYANFNDSIKITLSILETANA